MNGETDPGVMGREQKQFLSPPSLSPLSSPQGVCVCVCVRASVHVDGVEDPLGELLELGGRALGLVLQSLVVLPQPLDLDLQPALLLPLLQGAVCVCQEIPVFFVSKCECV